MRIFSLAVLAICLLATACLHREKKFTVKTEDGGKATFSLKDMAGRAEEMNKRTEELKKLTPVSSETIKGFFGEELLGMKRTEFNAVNSMGYTVGNAAYAKDDSTEIQLGIYDCAGESGAGFYSLQVFTAFNMSRENDMGYSKTIDFKGGKALEEYEKMNNTYKLAFMAAERFWVTLDGRNVSLDDLKRAAESLDFTKLK